MKLTMLANLLKQLCLTSLLRQVMPTPQPPTPILLALILPPFTHHTNRIV